MELYRKLKDMKILLIDDDEWIRDSLTIFFDGEGCHLTAFETAEEAVRAIEKDRYDIVISDYKLPGMDGLEFFRFIGRSHPHAIKIVITAYGNEDVALEAKRIGINALIEKPFTTQTIEKSLSHLIEGYEKDGDIAATS